MQTEVGVATYRVGNAIGMLMTSGNDRSKYMQGPTLPLRADHILAQEATEEQAMAEQGYQWKYDKAEA
jgi:hypothetical protein